MAKQTPLYPKFDIVKVMPWTILEECMCSDNTRFKQSIEKIDDDEQSVDVDSSRLVDEESWSGCIYKAGRSNSQETGSVPKSQEILGG